METRANYLLIGAITLLGILATFAFFLWYARIAIDRQYDYYTIRFEQVSGLSRAGDVRFNGILVGQVISIDLSRTGTQVSVEIQVQNGTPVDSGTIATLRSQGVTGVSYVSLASGPIGTEPLAVDPVSGLEVIRSAPSVIDSLIEGAPQLLAEATQLLRQLSGIVSPENQQRVTDILGNVEAASGGLQKALTDFSAISGTVREGVDQISAFTGRLDGIATQAQSTLKTADTALESATGAFDVAKGTLSTATGALDAAQTTFRSADTLITGRGPGLVDGYEGLARTLTATADTLGTSGVALLGKVDGAADLVTARLREAEAPIAAVAPALTAVQGAAGGVEKLVNGDGAALVADARTSLQTLNGLLETDAPQILADVRAASATVNRVVAEVGTDVSDFTGRLDGLSVEAQTALAGASETFRTANTTLQSLQPAVESAQRALASADSAFASADRIMSVDIEPVITDLRGAISRFNGAIDQVSADLPAVTAEARTAMDSASRAAQRLETLVGNAAPPIESFAQTGLPQFSRLAADARALIATIEQLTQRISRDPARFLLGGRAPEYRP